MADHDNALKAALAWAKTNMPAKVGVGVEQPSGSGAGTGTGTGTGTGNGTAAGEAGAAGGANTQGSGWIVLADEAYEDVNVSGTLLDGEGELKAWDELGAMEARSTRERATGTEPHRPVCGMGERLRLRLSLLPPHRLRLVPRRRLVCKALPGKKSTRP